MRAVRSLLSQFRRNKGRHISRKIFKKPLPFHRTRTFLTLNELEPRLVPSLMGNQLFPWDNPWNQQITNAPIAGNSATLVNSIGFGSRFHPDFGNALYAGSYVGIPFNIVSGSQGRVNVVIDAYWRESDLVPIPIPNNAVIEGDPLPGSQNTGDRHLLVYDRDNNILYETFNTHRPSETSDGRWHADAEAVWDLNRNSFRPAGWTSADAAGLPILPGLVRPDEVYDQGRIDHALRFTVPRSRDSYIYPASHEAGSNNSTYPRMGERFRLRQSFDISGFSPANRVILQALKDYGMIVADNGSGWYVSGEPSNRWDDNDLHQLTNLHGSDFEALDLSPVISGLSQSSGAASGGLLLTIYGVNFSGGAGQTQIFFGSTPAANFKIHSDGSITVLVPPHDPGTVDIVVQSPYGTSAIGGADQFTFLNGPLLGPPLFVMGLDNQVWVQYFDAAGNPLSGYGLTSSGQVKSFTVGHDGAGHPQLFVIGLDDQVYALKFDGNGNPVGGYFLTSPGRVKSLAAGNDAFGRPEIFVIGLDNQVYAQKFDAFGNPATGYFLTSPGQVKSLTVSSDATGNPETFVIGLDDQVYALKFDGIGTPFGGYFLPAGGRVKSVSVGHDSIGSPEVFVIGMDDQVYAQILDTAGVTSTGYFLTAVGRVKTLNVGGAAGGRPEIFVTGLDDQVWGLRLDSGGIPSGGYFLTAPGRIKAITVGHDAGGNLELFVQGLDDQIYAQKCDGGGTPLGAYFLTAVGRVLAVHQG